MTRREKNYHWRRRMLRAGLLENVGSFMNNIHVVWHKFQALVAKTPSGPKNSMAFISAYPLKEAYPDNNPDDLKDINILFSE